MSKYIECREFIPKSERPEKMPDGIAIKYYLREFDEAEEITPDSLCRILENLRSGKWEHIFLSDDDALEGNFMQLESGNGLYSLQFMRDNTGGTGEAAAWFTTYDPEYLDSNEETDIECSDGQSIIFREYTTADRDSVLYAIEYFIRTGKLWNGIRWMKQWEERAEESE